MKFIVYCALLGIASAQEIPNLVEDDLDELFDVTIKRDDERRFEDKSRMLGRTLEDLQRGPQARRDQEKFMREVYPKLERMWVHKYKDQIVPWMNSNQFQDVARYKKEHIMNTPMGNKLKAEFDQLKEDLMGSRQRSSYKEYRNGKMYEREYWRWTRPLYQGEDFRIREKVLRKEEPKRDDRRGGRDGPGRPGGRGGRRVVIAAPGPDRRVVIRVKSDGRKNPAAKPAGGDAKPRWEYGKTIAQRNHLDNDAIKDIFEDVKDIAQDWYNIATDKRMMRGLKQREHDAWTEPHFEKAKQMLQDDLNIHSWRDFQSKFKQYAPYIKEGIVKDPRISRMRKQIDRMVREAVSITVIGDLPKGPRMKCVNRLFANIYKDLYAKGHADPITVIRRSIKRSMREIMRNLGRMGQQMMPDEE